ncbi:hypothetical protein Syun_005692 [Stephania yunnanensis]|uniref:Carbohydrate kinase PfkB domain-containing protein n=1 Tax=Stephania yunnanensis TaxID=152371 RepID=A0AAP0L7Y3_9MAGN
MATFSTLSLFLISRCPPPPPCLLQHHHNFPIINIHSFLKLRAKTTTSQSATTNGDLFVQDIIPNSNTTSKRPPRRPRNNESLIGDDDVDDDVVPQQPTAAASTSKLTRKSPQKATTTTPTPTTKKVVGRRKTKKVDFDTNDRQTDAQLNDLLQDPTSLKINDDEDDEDLELALIGCEGDDISFTYSWPPLVCCFGAAQHAFVPSGTPANRLIDYEIHDRMKDAFWAPEKFVRAPGTSPASVAIALANLGGRVAFMGKLGDDDYGQAMLYYLNVNKVQTRALKMDTKKMTAVSRMKLIKRGGIRMNCLKPSAEDCLSRSEINLDVLKEAKMFYFNSSSLLNSDMRLTTLRAIRISKRLGGVIFFDLNLPFPLWKSGEEAKIFIQQAWNLADIIEVTQAELEFLCGIEPSYKFDSKDNDKSKFIHYEPEVVKSLWHENLKVLFVTNGTSKIHYYTEKHHGSVHGMEDAPITPFTSDMSASGDGIVAGLMRMLTVQPDLITDTEYLDTSIKYAINCGVIDQWILGRTRGFPPNENSEEELVSDPNGIRSITEKELRTLNTVVESDMQA